MGQALVVHDLDEDHVVLEIHEDLTAPGPALELHVVIDRGETLAWWAVESGRRLGEVLIGQA